MAIGTTSEKIANRGGRVEDLKFLGGIMKNYIAEIPEVNYKKNWHYQGVLKKVLVFGPGSSMRYNTIFPGLRGEALFCLEFLE